MIAILRKRFLKLLMLPVLMTVFSSCEEPVTDDPISALNGLVKEYGVIGHENPLESSGTGTMIGGRPNALAYVAPSEACFPDEQIQRSLDTQNFNKIYNYSFQGNLGFSVFGTALFSAGIGISKSHTVKIELNGITIEYMSAIDITNWYNEGMEQTCKDYLDDVGFIIQALITDSMKISIEKVGGTNIGLSADNIAQYIQFEAGVDWKIIDNYTVEVTTPKYIGYQLGRLRLEDNGRTLYRAMTAENDKFIFEPISLFPKVEETTLPLLIVQKEQAENTESELDQNSIFMK